MSAPRVPGEVEIELGLDEPDDLPSVRQRAARRLGVPVEALPPIELCRRTLDARRGRVRFHLVYALGRLPRPLGGEPLREARGEPDVVIVGDGPAGLFCAHELARHGVGSVVLDRGKPVVRRLGDVAALGRGGPVDRDSNYCFGEGGAGTFSDGKLYSRSHRRGDLRDVLEVLALHGAPGEILTDARPHVGSDRLPAIVTRLRAKLEQAGVRFRFDTRVVGLLTGPSGQPAVGVRCADGSDVEARAVVLATGHSARDVYGWLGGYGVALAPKPCAMGLRIEHPQALIDGIQYGVHAGHPRLGAASYRVAAEIDGRGVYSFCMCPGGFIVPASTEPDGLVVNGMSLGSRDSPYANSGLVVAVTPEDFVAAGCPGPLGGLALAARLERAALGAGQGALRAPATRVTDFLAGRASTTLPNSSYAPGLNPVDLGGVLAQGAPALADRIRRALPRFERQLRGYLTEEAVLVGVETRTSSPVRVLRDPLTLEAQGCRGLYPAGEGAGYAGGIMSSAVDGMAIARQILRVLGT
jgi:uncharacterized protein